MSHPFGDLLSQFLYRKHGLSQSKLADGVDLPRTVIGLMCQGQRLTGHLARERVVSIIRWLYQQQVLTAQSEANALLTAAGMANLNPANPDEARLLKRLAATPATPAVPAVRPAQHETSIVRHPALPQRVTSFIGREHEIEEIEELLAMPLTRLLTLTGPSGCGKTRLALQVAAKRVKFYSDGIWWVDLAALTDPDLIPLTVANVLGIREQTGMPWMDALIEYLQNREVLLVLDNCEHLVAACAQFVETLLFACPQLQILATSREALGISGERAWLVPSLTLPKNEFKVASSKLQAGSIELGQSQPSTFNLQPSALLESEAVRLFVERAKAVQPSFALTQQNVPAIVQICRELDGIPLAIELAAARMKVLTAGQIAERIGDAIRLLTSGSRTAMPRQQTLRAAIDWSYDLLSEQEQTVLRRLSVCTGGFTMDAAEAICSGEGVEVEEVLDLLAALVDKSLVMVTGQEQYGQARYRMLEIIRQYAHEKLVEAGNLETIRDHHLAFYLNMAEQAEPGLLSADQLTWFDRLEMEHDNLRTALSWSLEREQRPEHDAFLENASLRLAGALGWFWFFRGYYIEGSDWLTRVLAQSCNAPAVVRAKALVRQSRLELWKSRIEQGKSLAEEGLTHYREAGDIRGMAEAFAALGVAARMQVNRLSAQTLFTESLSLSRVVGYARGIAESLGNLGAIAREQGDYEQATRLLEESLEQWRITGEKWGIAWALGHLGVVAQAQGDYLRAAQLCEESLALNRTVGTKWSIANMVKTLGMLARLQGDYDRARDLCQESVRLAQEAGEKSGLASALTNLANVLLQLGEPEQARQMFEESLSLCQATGNRLGIVECFMGLAGVAGVAGNAQRAARLYGAAQSLRHTLGTVQDASAQVEYDRTISVAKQYIDEEGWASAWKEGTTMSLEQALAYAAHSPSDDGRDGS